MANSMTNNQAKLARLKAEHRAKSKRQNQLHKLIENSRNSTEERLAAFRTVMQVDRPRFSSALKKLLNEKEPPTTKR